MSTDFDNAPPDDAPRRATDPTQRAARPGPRPTLSVRRDAAGNPARGAGKPLRASSLNRDRLPRASPRQTEPPARAGGKPAPPRPPRPNRRAPPPRVTQPRRAQDARAARPAEHRANPPPPRARAQDQPAGWIRLSKRMSELGLCSRREADAWIPRGWVLVDGKPVTQLGSRVGPNASIEIHQAARSEQGERVTVLLNKPVGYVSGQAEDGHDPAIMLFTPDNQWDQDPTRKRFAPWQRKGLAPAGRLDIDSTGLLVLTQDGRVARHLIGEDSTIEKEYLVRVIWNAPGGSIEQGISKVFPADLLEKLRHGLSLDDAALKPAKVSWQNEQQLRFVLREGKKRQIRRMCEQVGLIVTGLKRIRMGRIALGDLPVGAWRFLGSFEKF